ncbi:unnamed protein product [Kuraishia capsulata CBS 1993]|uniref:DBF4-type domain-containing protein n=1 Tax=Kuraishia capsulata CBS 1993 TaxID=1382522 RepID=W6MM48_9ASCO|nr:uncharacterized protein KUCA_T00003598001 [Kuraishia capsulata CBS 1993]CDK27619.1 unnamed protein product [Kuraishia capsulata CBS 1993]
MDKPQQTRPISANSVASRMPLKDSTNTTTLAKSRQKRSLLDQRAEDFSRSNKKVEPRKVATNMSEWRAEWRKILPQSLVYFENDENTETQIKERNAAKQALEALGARTALFFSDKVTLFITRRQFEKNKTYPPGDPFRLASSSGHLKVWTYDKVFRFMKDLGEPDRLADSKKLSSLLQQEKLYGPTDRDPTAKRDDVRYFTGYYVYVYDLKQQYRPIIVKEWALKDADETYPRLHRSTNGRSLFVSDGPKAHLNAEARRRKRLAYFRQNAEFRESLVACSALPGLFKDAETRREYKLEWDELNCSPPSAPVDTASRLVPRLPRMNSNLASNANSGMKFNNAFGEIEASGVVQQSVSTVATNGGGVGNGLGPTKAFTSRRVLNDKKKVVSFDPIVPAKRAVDDGPQTPPKQTIAEMANPPKTPNNNAPRDEDTPNKSLKRMKIEQAVKAERRRDVCTAGYCENCRVKYDDFEDHVYEPVHRDFAVNDYNFADIDDLIAKIQAARDLGL